MNWLSVVGLQSTIELGKLCLLYPRTTTTSQPIKKRNIEEILESEDVETKVHMISAFLKRLETTDQSIQEQTKSVEQAIQQVQEEVIKIHSRLQYNQRIWFVSSLRCYKFEHCEDRLLTKLHILESRFHYLLWLLQIIK